MAVLLAVYQRMRLIREKNQATFDLTKYSGKLNRVQKNIERVQKRYTSILANLDKQAQMMQSNATVYFQQMAGLGANNYSNVMNPAGFTGMNGFVYGVMQKMFEQPYEIKDKNNEVTNTIPLGQEVLQRLYTEYMNGGGRFDHLYEYDNDTKQVLRDENNNPKIKDNAFNYYQIVAFQQAMQAGQIQQSQAQMWVQNTNQQYQSNVSIWLEAAKAEVEAEQDAALEPLNYQETMWELEKTSAETKLERIKAELESYNGLCKEEIQNSAPKFGLG